jgi:hypothetical protein
VKPGKVLLHRSFVFADGETADKYLVVLGRVGDILLAVKTTSRGHRYRNDHGCQSANRFPAFLLTAGCCCFPKQTWVCLGDFYELDVNELVQKVTQGQVYQFGELPAELLRDIQFCAKGCDDLSAHRESLIDQSL